MRIPAFALALPLTLSLLAPDARAWSEHHLITRAILADSPAVHGRDLAVTSFDSLMHDLGYPDAATFVARMQLHKRFRFEFRLGEKPGDRVAAVDVLSKYSDEPDWDMDKELFAPDQYPDLWRPEYAFMGGRQGTPSQAFRHMYWPFSLRHPIATFKLPKVLGSMGTAPDRADAFLILSRRARQHGHLYWSARFLADALHYLEDVSQPFHAAQTPSKIFLKMPLTEPQGAKTHDFVKQVTNVVAYYHFAFENYVAHVMTVGDAASTPAERAAFEAALKRTSNLPELRYAGDLGGLVRAMARVSSAQAPRAARAAIAFFPRIEVPYLTLQAETLVESPEWLAAVVAEAQGDSPEKRAYFATAERMFQQLGGAVRSVVEAELREP
jgi:hypothetical protein